MIVVLNHQGWGEPSWKMEINLEQICNLVGTKTRVQNHDGKWVYKHAYEDSAVFSIMNPAAGNHNSV